MSRPRLASSLQIVAVLALAGFSFGCQHRLTDFTVLSTKNVELSRMDNLQRTGDRVEGEDQKFVIFVVPIGLPDVKEAIDRAIEKHPGAVALADGVLHYKYFYIPFIWGWSSYVVEGTPLVDAASPAAPAGLRSGPGIAPRSGAGIRTGAAGGGAGTGSRLPPRGGGAGTARQ